VSRGTRALALATGALLAAALAMNPSLALESDETIGPVRSTGPEEVPADPLEMPETIPPVAGPSGLIAYQPEGAGTRRHWLDRPSIAIESPYVRATVVVESSSGARTISHYGFDCAEKTLALLATGRSDGGWRRLESVDWRPVTQGRNHTPYLTAIYKAVCDGGGPTRTVAQMIERLRNPLLDDY
jgi:hypothetical protein